MEKVLQINVTMTPEVLDKYLLYGTKEELADEILRQLAESGSLLTGKPLELKYINRKGRWKNESKTNPLSTCKEKIYWRVCSACGWCREDCNPANDTPYCPNCGAKMERRRK